jgi:hypothetical protein
MGGWKDGREGGREAGKEMCIRVISSTGLVLVRTSGSTLQISGGALSSVRIFPLMTMGVLRRQAGSGESAVSVRQHARSRQE